MSGPEVRVGDASARLLCENIHITTPDARAEYHSDAFGSLLSPNIFPNLHHVCVRSLSSSYWLKYNKCSHIRGLSLINADESLSVKVFCLSHLTNFTGLNSLTLHRYHFDWQVDKMGEDTAVPGILSRELPRGLNELYINDCTWQYPFNLALFNASDSLRTLAITYSHNNSFVISERFDDFLKNPLPGHSSSIRRLSIGFNAYTINKKLLTSAILITLSNAFKHLNHLHLYGWYTTELYAKVILSTLSFSFPVDVDVELVTQVTVQGASDVIPTKPRLRWKRRLNESK
ncbi:hypothetical protein JCM33374_g1414 [Metschnikowia sp. JCM 33374]|nr:hypothetical protein JCM33374_g1414 [Metschnikowia sp. JCM 33374]